MTELQEKLKKLGVLRMATENTKSVLSESNCEITEANGLTECFVFKKSPQGFSFWDEIATKLGEW